MPMAEVQKEAEEIELLLQKHGVTLGASSDLLKMMFLAKQARKKYIGCSFTTLELFRLLQFRRISEAMIVLKSEKDPSRYLRTLARGSLDLFSKRRSRAKDALWELELCAMLRRGLKSTYLLDPPDIMIEYKDARLGVSCKKIYSESHMQNIMSEAMGQIRATCEVGVIAMNLDSMIPYNAVLRESTFESAIERLDQTMAAFLERHQRHFKRYFARKNLLAVLATISPVSEIISSRIPYNTVTQSRIWTTPETRSRLGLHFEHFRKHIEAIGSI